MFVLSFPVNATLKPLDRKNNDQKVGDDNITDSTVRETSPNPLL